MEIEQVILVTQVFPGRRDGLEGHTRGVYQAGLGPLEVARGDRLAPHIPTRTRVHDIVGVVRGLNRYAARWA